MAGKKKNPAAVALGKLGGAVKVPKGFAMLSPAARKASGKKAAKARWAAVKGAKAKAAKKGEEAAKSQ